MRNRRLILVLSLTGFLVLTALMYLKFDAVSEETETRQKLNELLGEEQPLDRSNDAPELAPLKSESAPATEAEPQAIKPEAGLPSPSDLLFGFPTPQSDVGVEETSANYVIRVPLASEADSSSVKLNVTPHQIEISGQTGSQENGKSVQSSFMQTFTTSQEVLPDQVHRLTEKHGEQTELVITIPKKLSSKAPSLPEYPGLDDDGPAGAGNAQSQITPPSPPSDSGNPNPLDTYSNRTF